MSEPPSPPVPAPDTPPTRTTDSPGSIAGQRIGPYQLRQKVGEGGMGEVWMAEQIAPIRRQVAVKIIKAGMDTARVIARFDAERQALALMDHPAIATVFDGGATAEGRPYFAMEYVRGEPITAYCDRYRLSTHERLELFVQRLRGRAARAPEGRDSPRPEALERPGHGQRRHGRPPRSSTSGWPRPPRST